MNIKKLFEMQKVLKDRIGYNGEDRLNKLILALLVELGECANEWRGFKFWSKDQEPKTKALRYPAMMEEDKEYYNPLLEEFVDGLHFILELGIELDFVHVITDDIKPIKNDTIANQFIFISTKVGTLLTYQGIPNYIHIVQNYLGLGQMLGFTWEEIEQAYIYKNKINHERQESGY